MAPVGGDEFRVALARETRRHDLHRVVQAEADDVARPLGVRHRQAEGAARPPPAPLARARRVDDRAIPVEHDQPVFHPNPKSGTDHVFPETKPPTRLRLTAAFTGGRKKRGLSLFSCFMPGPCRRTACARLAGAPEAPTFPG